ncbi:MAG TPA: type II CAAX endopeptidase family protein [bacterium]|nr:type II CAAX endopeptidase family protein [bacterium]
MRRYPLVAFFVLAFLFSWLVAVPLALQRGGVLPARLPYSLHYLMAFGPMLAALIVVGATEGRPALGRFLTRGFRLSVGWGWLTFALLAPLAFFGVGVVAAAVSGRAVPGIHELGQVNFLPNLGLGAWLLWILTSGLGEETGWRGYALPRLQSRRSPLAASLILAVPWVLWHLPAFFYLPNYMSFGVMLPGFALGVAAGSIVYTWLYNKTGGSILAAVLFHGSFNFVTASQAGTGLVAAVASTLVMVWAVVILIRWKSVRRSIGATPRVQA